MNFNSQNRNDLRKGKFGQTNTDGNLSHPAGSRLKKDWKFELTPTCRGVSTQFLVATYAPALDLTF